MPASISRRAFLHWPPQDAHEQTSTIVLTSPELRFVDLRIIETQAKDVNISPSRVEWAFAGTSSTTWRAVVDDPKIAPSDIHKYAGNLGKTHKYDGTPLDFSQGAQHCVWQHCIDSQYINAAQVQDEGDMFIVPSLGLTLEKGNMINPVTGRLADYVEGWEDEEILPQAAVCTVLELTDMEAGTKGMLIRLGQWIQGVARHGEEISLQRWHFEHGAWTAIACLGRAMFPIKEVAPGIRDEERFEYKQSESLLNVGQKVETMDENGKYWQWSVFESKRLDV